MISSTARSTNVSLLLSVFWTKSSAPSARIAVVTKAVTSHWYSPFVVKIGTLVFVA